VARKNKVWRSVDPLSEWKKGLVGWIHRHRGVVFQLATESGVAGYFWKSRQDWRLAVAVLACCSPATFFFTLERRYWIRELHIGADFHKVTHFLRDEVAKLRRLARQHDQGAYVNAYGELHAKICDRLALYFRSSTNDTTVNCALRLAVDEGGGVVYKTVGRSIGMDEQRDARSKSIPVDQGLARKLRDHDHLGVCHIRDIKEAIEDGWWMACPSDEFDDVKVVMAAPVNWYDSATHKKSMGGIFYVTSRRDNLGARLVEPIKAFADLLGSVYPSVTGRPVSRGTRTCVQPARQLTPRALPRRDRSSHAAYGDARVIALETSTGPEDSSGFRRRVGLNELVDDLMHKSERSEPLDDRWRLGRHARDLHSGRCRRQRLTQRGCRNALPSTNTDSKSPWRTSTAAVRPAAPEAISVRRDGTMLITLSNALVLVGRDHVVKRLLDETYWGSLYPNSSVLTPTEDKLYIGMRQYVAGVNLEEKTNPSRLRRHTSIRLIAFGKRPRGPRIRLRAILSARNAP
jgi:hypothetical protein